MSSSEQPRLRLRPSGPIRTAFSLAVAAQARPRSPATSSNRYIDRSYCVPNSSPLLAAVSRVAAFADAKQRPFRSLTSAFRRSLQDEVLFAWCDQEQIYDRHLDRHLLEEVQTYGDHDFDLRAVAFMDKLLKPLQGDDDAAWLRGVKRAKELSKAMSELAPMVRAPYTILIDAIDDSWDGSQLAVTYLTALMHAVLEVNTQVPDVRALLFLRENIFERVRLADSEFARLETCVVPLDWTTPQLVEMIERRLNAPLNTNLALGGETWDAFFEDGAHASEYVFGICQRRPRDVITYVGLALDTAQANRHDKIMLEDLYKGRRRFSDSRLKDLGDEYQENYAHLNVVLGKFYGLGTRWTLRSLADLLARMLIDDDVKSACKGWIYSYSSAETFARLLYDIGFLGFKRDSNSPPVYRALGPTETTPPPLRQGTDLVIHPSYWEALDLQDVLVREFSGEAAFGRPGVQFDLPGALDFEIYQEQLQGLLQELKELPEGKESAARFEDLVGDVLRLCFFRVLANVEDQVREVDGVVRRDWVAANRAEAGFWRLLRDRYAATQVVFECKNYEDLSAGDFQQASYYFSAAGGRVVFLVFRGEVKNHYYAHVKRCAERDGLVMLLNVKDLSVFVRQALKGHVKDEHLQDRYDTTIRKIS